MVQHHTRQVGGLLIHAGDEFEWKLAREPQWCGVDGIKGVTVEVSATGGAFRTLLLEYPFVPGVKRRQRRPVVSPADVGKGIAEAIAAGWEPHSRGKAFAYQV